MKTTLLHLLALFALLPSALAQGTAFTYQGRLADNGVPATGIYDLRFTIYDALENGNALAGTNTLPVVPVTNGLFTVTLDFGSAAFDGAARWLQIAVRTNGGAGAYATLAPRQPVTPVPYAITAGRVTGSVADAQLSANVARLNASQTFTGTPTFAATAGPPFLVNGTNPVANLNAGLLGGKPASAFWQLNGNSGSNPGVNFLGTIDNQPLELKVNGQRALRLEPIAGTANVIGGYSGNSVAGNSAASTIAGGGRAGLPNYIQADYSSIGGGRGNTIETSAHVSTIGGGERNTIQQGAYLSAIGGGFQNVIQTNAADSTIGGGEQNTNETNAAYSTIGGGGRNVGGARFGTIAGGDSNVIEPLAQAASIGGGAANLVQSGALRSTISGGEMNLIRTGVIDGAVSGGQLNTVGGHFGLAAGRRAKAETVGTFVWADSTDADFISTGPDQFLIRASGGVGLGTAAPESKLHVKSGGPAGRGFRLLQLTCPDAVDQVFEIPNAGLDNKYWVWGTRSVGENVLFGALLNDAQTASTPWLRVNRNGMSIDSVLFPNGNIGIGTSAPIESLHLDKLGDNFMRWSESGLHRAVIGIDGGANRYLDGVADNDFLIMAGGNINIKASTSSGGGPHMYLSTSGNVGIGTTTPQTPLDVTGAPFLQGDLRSVLFLKDNSPAGQGVGGGITFFGRVAAPSPEGTGYGMFAGIQGVKENGVMGNVAGALVFMTSRGINVPDEKLRITSSGNVGIGTGSPQARLDVVGNLRLDGYIVQSGDIGRKDVIKVVRSDATKWSLADDGTGKMTITGPWSNGVEPVIFQIDPTAPPDSFHLVGSGNVGIGTISPQTKLHVAGTVKATSFIGDGSGLTGVGAIGPAGGDLSGSYPNPTVANNAVTSAKLASDAASLSKVSGGLITVSGGNLGIGIATPQAKLDVAGTARIGGELFVNSTGTVKVLTITGGADVAEPFHISTRDIPKGSVVVIDEEHPGQLKLSDSAYDRRVAGIVSGAGGVQPGITLSQQGVLEGGQNVALSGRVYVQADATESPIKPGDLLTTSAVPGHAMKVQDHAQAQGAILGKAMSRLESGQGLVLVLVTLQ